MGLSWHLIGLLMAPAIVLVGTPAVSVEAQMNRNRVASSVVLLSARVERLEFDGEYEYRDCFLGSGTVVSSDGRFILTNYHVAIEKEKIKAYAANEEAALKVKDPSRQVELDVSEMSVWVVDNLSSLPRQRYQAEVQHNDPTLDLSVVRITGESNGLTHEDPINLDGIPFGVSSSADEVVLFGYSPSDETSDDSSDETSGDPVCVPVPERRPISRFTGYVSQRRGNEDDPIRIDIDATAGNSGGAVVDDQGRLVGIPLTVRQITSGPIVEVLPIERILQELETDAPDIYEVLPKPSGLEDDTSGSTSPLPSPTAVPTQSPPTPTLPASTPTPNPSPLLTTPPDGIGGGSESKSPDARPAYRVGELVAPTGAARLRAKGSTDSDVVEVVYSGTILRITGPPMNDDQSSLLWWPVADTASGANGFVREDLIGPPPVYVPMRRGNPARTGAMVGPGPAGQPVIRWQAEFPDWPGVVAIVGSLVYVRSTDSIDALNAETGDGLWHAEIAGTESPAVVAGVVYADSTQGLDALDSRTGDPIWDKTLPGLVGIPAVSSGVVYICSSDGVAYAFDTDTRQERWHTKLEGKLRDPAIAGGMMFVNSREGSVFALDAATGEELWTQSIAKKFESFPNENGVGAPAVEKGVVYISTAVGNLFAFDARTGMQLWNQPIAPSKSLSAPAVFGGRVYVTSSNGFLFALDTETGEVLWRKSIGDDGGTVTVADRVIYVGSFDGYLIAFDERTGQDRWRLVLDGSASFTTVAGGMVYVGTSKGVVYAIGDPDNS